jgi:hypothetical protein
MSKHGKLPAKRLKQIVLDYFQAEDITVAKKKLLADTELVLSSSTLRGVSLPRYPDRNGDLRTAREVDDIFDILDKLDERLLLLELPRYVFDSTESVPSVKLEDGDLRYILAKLDKMEAIIHGLQAAVNSVHSLVAAIKPLPPPSRMDNDCLSHPDTDWPRPRPKPKPDKHSSQATAPVSVQPSPSPRPQSGMGKPTKTIRFVNENKGVPTIRTESPALVSNRWAVLATGSSTTENSAHESADEGDYELVDSRRRRRRRIKQSSKDNSPLGAPESFASTVQRGNPTDGGAMKSTKPTTADPGNKASSRPGKTLIVGKGTSVGLSIAGSASHLVAARQFKALYCVDNVDECTEVNDLVQFVSGLGVRVISCFKVKPRISFFQRENRIKPAHSTFRLCINRADTKQLLQASKWPSDILISEWFFSSKKNVVSDKMGNEFVDKMSDNMSTPYYPAIDHVADCVANSIKAIRDNGGITGLPTGSPIDMDQTILFNEAATCNSPVSVDIAVCNLDSTHIDRNG